jgi:hypothetical protein
MLGHRHPHGTTGRGMTQRRVMSTDPIFNGLVPIA